jgi:predicted GNAT family acetyltransferase
MGQNFPLPAELTPEETLDCFQMVIPETVASPASQTDIVPLSRADSHDMVALTTLAFPGFFRERTCEMGTYYGVRSNEGELIAMGGERLRLHHFSEVSGVCTHPYHRGKGLAAAIIWQLIRQHRRGGTVSWLHVGCANANAIELYHRMGFDIVRKLILTRIRRKPATLLEIPPPNDY